MFYVQKASEVQMGSLRTTAVRAIQSMGVQKTGMHRMRSKYWENPAFKLVKRRKTSQDIISRHSLIASGKRLEEKCLLSQP